MEDARITYQEFLDTLKFSDTANELTQLTFNFLGRDLTQADVESDETVGASLAIAS